MSTVVVVNPGELHWMLNPNDDTVKPKCFRPWFESFFRFLFLLVF